MSSQASGPTAKELRAAWDEMIASLERARDAIEDPQLMPPPPVTSLRGYWLGGI